MHMLTLFLFAMIPIGADKPATPATQGVRTWTHDELARELGRSVHAESPGPLITGVKAVPLMLEVLPKEVQGQNTTTKMRAVATQCTNKDPAGGRALDGNREKPNQDDRDWQYSTR